MKFPIVFRLKAKKNSLTEFIVFRLKAKKNSLTEFIVFRQNATVAFFMTEDNQNIIPDLTDIEEVRKAIIANEILTRKY